MAESSMNISTLRVRDSPSFDILKSPKHNHEARIGRLHVPNRSLVETPHYIAISSRGAVPHLSQDMMRDNTRIQGIYAAVEDSYAFPCLPTESPLRRFIALQSNALLVLGPRRHPPVETPTSNTYTSISTLTSVGFRGLEIKNYIEAAQKLRPDVTIGCGDIMFGGGRSGAGLKRKEKMGERTMAWMKGLITGIQDNAKKGVATTSVWAPILPIDAEMQREYLEYLQDCVDDIGGIALYEAGSIDAIPHSLDGLPRISFTEPDTPHRLLHEISLGVDISTLPFLTNTSDIGIALDFKFPAPPLSSARTPLGIDMWLPAHATDISPLQKGCECYACANHHRAYVHHLLSVKEMLAWVLLQVHNHHIIDKFFAGVRNSIGQGTLVADSQAFEQVYETEMPLGTGTGPRKRGYEFNSTGPAPKKKNPSAYRKYDKVASGSKQVVLPDSTSPQQQLNDGMEKLAVADEADPLGTSFEAEDLEAMGFGKMVGEQ